MSGSFADTYAAAVSNGLADVGDATLVGVVRRPPAWFDGVVDENVRPLGPPADLVEAVQARRDELAARGMCDEGAHNAAFEELDVRSRYQRHLDSDEAARDALDALTARVEGGESVVLVCLEGPNKACHRRPLCERLRRRVD